MWDREVQNAKSLLVPLQALQATMHTHGVVVFCAFQRSNTCST